MAAVVHPNLSKFYKNLILCGEVDFYCLLCCEIFKNYEEIEKHIRWEQHRKAIKVQATNYLPKFRKDFIHKIQKYFYCEICNFITEDNTKIIEHIKRDEHISNKQNPNQVGVKTNIPIPKRDKYQQVYIDETPYTLHKWMGLTSNHCVLCDTAVKNSQEHITTMPHMISMIQSHIIKCKLENYRKINEETVLCFECEKRFPLKDLEGHAETNCKSMFAMMAKYFEVNTETKQAKCNKCGVLVKALADDMLDHKSNHTADSDADDGSTYKITDHGKRRKELKAYGAPNFIKLNEGGCKGYCSLCDVLMSAHINVFQSHVKGARHTAHLEIKGLIKKSTKTEKPWYKTKSLQQFLRNVEALKSDQTFWVNEEFTVDWASVVMIAPYPEGKKHKCYVCNETMIDYKAHSKLSSHNDKLFKMPVLFAPEIDNTEFVREVHPGLYHCGHCNSVHPTWNLLFKHLQSHSHFEKKWDSRRDIARSIFCNLHNRLTSTSDDECHEDFLL